MIQSPLDFSGNIKLKKGLLHVVKITFFTLLLCISCAGNNGLLDKSSIGGNYTINMHKSKNSNAIISGGFFHMESKNEPIPAYMNINGVIYQADSGQFSINVLPGSYKIQGGYIGKKWIVIQNISVVSGDSVFLTLYLIDDNRPLYEK